MNSEALRQQFMVCLKRNDEQGLSQLLRDVVKQAVANPEQVQEIIKLLTYWQGVSKNRHLTNFKTDLLTICANEQRHLQTALASAHQQIAQLQQATHKQQTYIEKLMLLADVMELQADPRHQNETQLELLQTSVRQLQQESGQLRQKLQQQVKAIQETL